MDPFHAPAACLVRFVSFLWVYVSYRVQIRSRSSSMQLEDELKQQSRCRDRITVLVPFPFLPPTLPPLVCRCDSAVGLLALYLRLDVEQSCLTSKQQRNNKQQKKKKKRNMRTSRIIATSSSLISSVAHVVALQRMTRLGDCRVNFPPTVKRGSGRAMSMMENKKKDENCDDCKTMQRMCFWSGEIQKDKDSRGIGMREIREGNYRECKTEREIRGAHSGERGRVNIKWMMCYVHGSWHGEGFIIFGRMGSE